jgi:OOP family OmpA-OmpF porin
MTLRSKGIGCAFGIFLLVPPALAQVEPEESCAGKVRLHGPIWDLTKQELEPGLGAILDVVARTIRERCGTKVVIIEGHAYELPAPELDLELSELRAALVRYELVKRGVPETQLKPMGFGDTQPLFSSDQPDAALRNRRITFRVAD